MESKTTSFYNPSREDTKNELDKLRSIVEHRLGSVSPIVISGVTDVVLLILKCEHHCFETPLPKIVVLKKLINSITDQVFEQMLQTAQRITDYPNQDTVHRSHNDQPLMSMAIIVAYNLLIRVYAERSVPRDEAYEMVLILNDESADPIDAQKQRIGDLLSLISDRLDWEVLAFIIAKLFPQFVCLLVIAPWMSFKGGEHEKVVKALWASVQKPERDRFFGVGVQNFKPCSRSVERVHVEVGSWRGGFEESENELGSVGTSAPGDVPQHPHRPLKLNNSGSKGEAKLATKPRLLGFRTPIWRSLMIFLKMCESKS